MPIEYVSRSVFFNQLKNTNMITTVDGVVKKRGEIIYELAYCKGYIPLKSIVHVSVQNELHAYSTLDLCQKECDRRNELRTS